MSDGALRPKVVIVGAGFGGLRAARALRGAPVDVLLLDRNNYHLFQPLLYQVATAGLTPSEIAYPVRAILRGQENASFRVAEVTGLDVAAKILGTADGPIPYDSLVLAIGAETNWFHLEGVERNGFALKTVADAVSIRNHVLSCFEKAVAETDPAARAALLTFVVAGGGPTGVEMAGALSELLRLVLKKDHPALDVHEVRVVLVESAPQILGGMPESLREAARRSLERKGVQLRLGALVEDFDGRRVKLKGGDVLPAATLIWAAGAKATSLTGKIGLETAAAARIVVEPTLQVPGHPEIYVIGDAAYPEANGMPIPMMAPPAIQMGELAAGNIARSLRGEPPRPFRYKDPGSLATIGRNSAVAFIRGWKFTGFLAWVVWLFVHLVQLIGFRNRIVVLLDWAWDYFLYERAVRLITRE
jgi:NADH dehydrogenase